MTEKLGIDQVVAGAGAPSADRASSRLKSRIYSKLVETQAASGPLRSLTETRKLCVFEELVQISPVSENLKRRNPCRVCHARLLGEDVENAPIYWAHCPYVLFQNR